MLFSTYNIHYGVGADGKYDLTRIADAVAEADIICLQETVRGWPQNGYADQTAEIGRRLNRYFRFHGPMEADASTVSADGFITNRRRSFGNAIVSRWPILWSRGIMLPKMRLMNGFDLQRGYIEAAIAIPSGQPPSPSLRGRFGSIARI
jgi:endonuclease/exonuclease/phosphatase family metal-dependent hydrolase